MNALNNRMTNQNLEIKHVFKELFQLQMWIESESPLRFQDREKRTEINFLIEQLMEVLIEMYEME